MQRVRRIERRRAVECSIRFFWIYHRKKLYDLKYQPCQNFFVSEKLTVLGAPSMNELPIFPTIQ